MEKGILYLLTNGVSLCGFCKCKRSQGRSK